VVQNVTVATEDPDDVALSDTDRVSLWLMSVDGRRALNRTLRDLKLPAAFDADLVIQVCHAADQMTAKGQPITSIAAWTTRVLRLRGIDLVRSGERQASCSARINGAGAGDSTHLAAPSAKSAVPDDERHGAAYQCRNESLADCG